MIRAIIFDCFGVLTNDGWKMLRETYCTTDELLARAHDLDSAVNSGFMSDNDFLNGVAELCGLDKAEVERAFAERHTNTVLFDFIATKLKPTYKIGLLSNASGNILNELFTPDQVAMFDAVTLSCDLGVVKPHVKMYEDIAAKLNAQTNECLFTDDIEQYCTGAREAGMQAVQYTDFWAFEQDIEKLLQ